MLRRKALLKRLRNSTPANPEARLARVAASITIDKPILSSPSAFQHRSPPPVSEPKYALSVGSSQGLLSTKVVQPKVVSARVKRSAVAIGQLMAPRKRTVLRRKRTSGRSISEVRVLSRQGGIRQLRWYLQHEDVVLIAIDTESERRGLLNHVVEVGLSVLRTRDIHNVEPGAHVNNWITKVRHHHIVVDVTRCPRRRMRGSRFGRSLFLSPGEAKDELLSIMKSSTKGIESNSIAFVGHSLGSDIQAVLQSPDLATDLLDMSRSGPAVFDTVNLATAAEREGAHLPAKNLSSLARSLQVDPRYFDETGVIRGWHNASNDAAYTMMALLLFGARWQDLVQPSSPLTNRTRFRKPDTENHTSSSWLSRFASALQKTLFGRSHRTRLSDEGRRTG